MPRIWGWRWGSEAPKYQERFNAACETLFQLADQLVVKVRRGEDSESYVARMVAEFDPQRGLHA